MQLFSRPLGSRTRASTTRSSTCSASRSPTRTLCAYRPRRTGAPTALRPGPWRFLSGRSDQPMTELGWKSLGLLELTALPSMGSDRWVQWVRETDALLVNGGDALYLSHWMRKSGLADLLPSLRDTVWVGFSAGSMVLTPRIGEDFVGWKPPGGGDEALGVVDFSIFPHVDHPDLPENTMAEAERWAAGLSNPAYAIDDDTAIKVVDDTVEVVSEGHWKLFPPARWGANRARRRVALAWASVREFIRTSPASDGGCRSLGWPSSIAFGVGGRFAYRLRVSRSPYARTADRRRGRHGSRRLVRGPISRHFSTPAGVKAGVRGCA